MSVRRIMPIVGCLALLWGVPAQGQKALAFIAEVGGKATVKPSKGKEAVANTGLQLNSGDVVTAKGGGLSIVYLSGRQVKLKSGESHTVKRGKEKSSDLMNRVLATLDEIAGTEQPTVHGMARALGITGALPARTRLSHGGFFFDWDPIDGAEKYEFTLRSEDGEVVVQKTVTETQLAAGPLYLEPGKRYKWHVSEVASFMARSSLKEDEEDWIEIAPPGEVKDLHKTIRKIESKYEGKTENLLKATTFYREGFFYEAEQTLVSWQQQSTLSKVERRMLMLSYAKMGRWERLPAPEAKE